MCLLYACSVLAVTTGWVYFRRHDSLAKLALAMFFPGVMAAAVTIFNGEFPQFLYTTLGFHKPLLGFVYSLVSLAAVYGMVGACAAMVTSFKWGEPARGNQESAIHAHNKSTLSGFLRAAGEEIGWRSYLLPCLMASYTPVYAMLIGGIIWGLFHVPVMIVLTHKIKPARPNLTVTVQWLACVFAAYPHSWVAIKAGYSMWPSTVMHAVWNFLNPVVLGSIYTQTPGRLVGPQWLINGEGLTGCIVHAFIAVFLVWELQNPEYLQKILTF